MNIKAFKAVFPKVDLITSPSSFFSNIKYQYTEYRESGFYSPVDEPTIYVYQIKTKLSLHTGLLCCTDVDELRKHKLLKHEKTLAAKEQQMMHLFLQRKALVKPVLLGYKPFNGVEEELKTWAKRKKPTVKIAFPDKEEHRIWKIDDPKKVDLIIKKFKELDKAYIGDGHHRSTTCLLLNSSKDLGEDAHKYDQLLTAYFPFNELRIWDYNRIVDIADIMPTSQFVALLSQYFKITRSRKAIKPSRKHQVSFYIDGVWYLMEWKAKYLSKGRFPVVLDTALINYYIFEKILKIKDIRLDTRISYYSGTDSLAKIVRHTHRRKAGVAICIYPVSDKELTEVADSGQTLPPKSTWFVPRLKSGIIAKDL
ncbi:MAG: DUF1015 domain-containing protein [Saprospiraceae bacterium]|nr:DUF1015 domain-containing protein [Saprospiraceae bacterium]